MSDEGEKASWLEPLPDEYGTAEDMTGRRMMVAALTVVILAIFGGLIWYSYLEGTDNGPVPVVRADNSVVKEKPDTPGGMQVPDQDKSVFDKVASVQADESEKLEASAELPIDRPVKKAVEEEMPVVEEVPQSLPPTQNEIVAREVATIAPASEGKIGNFLVQLGAFGKKETAKQLWNKIQNDNSALLAGLSSDIMMIDLGKKGVLYRLRGGMIDGRPAADAICVELKTKKQACIVVAK